MTLAVATYDPTIITTGFAPLLADAPIYGLAVVGIGIGLIVARKGVALVLGFANKPR
jgi:hypothetical protein